MKRANRVQTPASAGGATLHEGLTRFHDIFQGWLLAKDVYKREIREMASHFFAAIRISSLDKTIFPALHWLNMKTAIAAKRRTENTPPPPRILTRPVDAGPRGLAAGESALFSDKYATGNIRLVQQLMRGNYVCAFGLHSTSQIRGNLACS
jgi:hypothetical protein